MLPKEITQSQQYIYNALQECHLQKAFARLRTLSTHLQEWDVDSKLNELETSYHYMIQYMLDGVDDPERTLVHNRLIAATYNITDKLYALHPFQRGEVDAVAGSAFLHNPEILVVDVHPPLVIVFKAQKHFGSGMPIYL